MPRKATRSPLSTSEDADITKPAVYTIAQFIKAHQFSRGKFYQMVANGEGPDFMEVGTRKFVTFESAARWRQKLTKRQR